MEIIDKFVKFEDWCPKCKFKNVEDTKGEDPCNECLAYGTNVNSTKPVKFQPKDITSGKPIDKNEPEIQVQIV